MGGIPHGPPAHVGDDNQTNRRILQLQTLAWGMEPYAVTSGEEALVWIRHGGRFEVALLDMCMPEMDGVMLAQALRAEPVVGRRPIVLLTSVGRGEVRERVAAEGLPSDQLFSALLTKPAKAGQREDNRMNQLVAQKKLERMGYRADVAANGFEVLAALDRQPYDVVLINVQMPEMDGLEASRQIRRRFAAGRQPRSVALTANALHEDRELCLAAGMDDYISKLVRVEEVVGGTLGA